MKKNVSIIIIVTALSLLVNWAGFLMVRRTKELQNQKIQKTYSDSLLAKVDSLQGLKLKNPLLDLKAKILAVHQKNILKKMLLHPETNEKVNKALLQQVDLALKAITNIDSSYINLTVKLENQKKAMQAKDKKINELLTQLQEAKNVAPKVDVKQQAEKQEEQKINLNYLAKTYESMKPAAAVPSLLLLDNDNIISVLKLMNTRKRAKLLAAFPAAKAGQIANLMAKGNK